jgi:hypothetical protein
MGLPSTSLKFILNKKKKYNFSGPVLTFGNQDIYAKEADIRNWAQEYDIKLNEPEKIIYSTSGDIPKINKEASKYIHARTFFEFMGISGEDYYDIDKFDFDKPKIRHDLQYPIDQKYHNFFNFIIDSGTLEHIFDVRSVMENIVKITKVGGYVLQFIPAQNMLNHGFYQISPTFFYDFYIVNGFKIVESYIMEGRGNADRFWQYDQERDYIGLFFNPKRKLASCFLVRKKEDVGRINLPDQYMYKKLAEDSKAVDKDFNQSGLDKIVNSARGFVPIKYHALFFVPWQFLKRITSKRKYFDIRK